MLEELMLNFKNDFEFFYRLQMFKVELGFKKNNNNKLDFSSSEKKFTLEFFVKRFEKKVYLLIYLYQIR